MDYTNPPIPIEIVQWLTEHFPDKLPAPATPQHEILALCGEQRVIRFVKAAFDRQSPENVFAEENPD